jgi:regulatory protein
MKSKPEPGELRERAMRLLARREHSRAELVRKLGQAGFDGCDIQLLLDEFEEKRWLSDRRFAESYVADHRARAGAAKLVFDLRQRGVADNIIEAVLSRQPRQRTRARAGRLAEEVRLGACRHDREGEADAVFAEPGIWGRGNSTRHP